ncbi:hypothetical protein FNV43_RR14628 [Rhamnella rubrinervis]|uniref:PXMP2/4 family protein 4 n=1 Tax=Rhamnella rubrinervis TaxID=2594499 RepID=A0A8K0MGJ3_9ROSA|nr:hypothetical protein FNV43_RR14628 [Rhamnella rubrinervis]
MKALSSGHGGLWGWNRPPRKPKPHNSERQRRRSKSNSSNSLEANQGPDIRFPFRQAVTASSLALTGDTIAQLRDRWKHAKASRQQHSSLSDSHGSFQDIMQTVFSDHDWLRSLRMASYGFLLYGPGSYMWYQYLDHSLPKQTVGNLIMKVLLNQIVLGPCVIAVVFAWNDLWKGKLSQLPDKYQKDALPTLLYGWYLFKLVLLSCRCVRYSGTFTCLQL